MYLEYYGLREFPFSLTPDTQFFLEYGHYRDAFNTLLIALRSGEGFIKVSGEVGTGKTLLCRRLLTMLDDEFYTAYVPNPLLTPAALNLALAEELGLHLARNLGQHRVLKEITAKLMQLAADHRRAVLLIDEAQAMPEETLEALRLLTNLETEKRKLLQVVLFGQPELDAHLNRPSIRQLRQRITFSYKLQPIDRTGLDAYLAHRMSVAGAAKASVFTPQATDALYRYSRGIPRLINILAHKALMAGYGQGSQRIDRSHIKMAAADTEDVHVHLRSFLRQRAVALVAVGAAIALVALLAMYSGGIPLLGGRL